MSEQLCLRWNDFKDIKDSAFVSLRNDVHFADVTLACEDGHQVKAHKVILATASPFFQNILKKNQHPHPLIYMRALKSGDLGAIVDFLYNGEVDIFQENLDSFLAIAAELQLKGLVDQSDEHTNRKVHEKKEVRPREVKVPFENGQNDVSLYRPSSIVLGGAQNPSNIIIEKNDRVLALPSSFSGGLGLEELAEKVKSFMGTTLGKTGDGKRNLYHCKICGKEGQSIHIQNHIEANHLEGVSLPCDQCDKNARSRRDLTEHKRRYHAKRI